MISANFKQSLEHTMYDIKRQKLKGIETQTVHHDISELSVKEARAKVPVC